ncbi:Non-specific lipid-transfer protein-like protein family [Quillaja saponaria]|uniref:Non-specific lipid-transfer protein-like protein family n=1 Tax=Quillaja saponaria TaxID=32244 RepID=A0AAD7Q0S6_QUISA|nr:Non-specific lipid-transfer protein-like protein family [Quillaja saponaria]
MAPKGIILALVLVLVAILWNPTAAQSGCTSALTSMASCLNYITGNSSTPSASCCSQLSSVAQSSPQCLCSVLNGGGAPFAININQTLALSLPGACKIQMPPISQCRAAAAPTTSISPVGSPADSSNEKPDAAISPSEAGAK